MKMKEAVLLTEGIGSPGDFVWQPVFPYGRSDICAVRCTPERGGEMIYLLREEGAMIEYFIIATADSEDGMVGAVDAVDVTEDGEDGNVVVATTFGTYSCNLREGTVEKVSTDENEKLYRCDCRPLETGIHPSKMRFFVISHSCS